MVGIIISANNHHNYIVVLVDFYTKHFNIVYFKGYVILPFYTKHIDFLKEQAAIRKPDGLRINDRLC